MSSRLLFSASLDLVLNSQPSLDRGLDSLDNSDWGLLLTEVAQDLSTPSPRSELPPGDSLV